MTVSGGFRCLLQAKARAPSLAQSKTLRPGIPMGKLAPVTTLLIATRNLHKVEEIRAILGEQFRYLTLQSFPAAPEVVEDLPTFSGNATKKAVLLAKWLASTPNQDGHTRDE